MTEEYADEDWYVWCPSCSMSMDWEDCALCGGEGCYDAYEDDPLWYQPGDTAACAQCDAKGGWWICMNRQCRGEP